ncbi:(d)CMP kinase [Parvularcula sp. ZS-1/3]|uniref:Cytidylate kinase n=1 Tax=Parvularcula mediterranea TaxID=2732508 RepID=A0A7Y3RNC2_9PROT|nr:(d)CMP kinase [Parvularcula mediterranea]NNU17209.1 (d)CMP kinase [Parvularcula mediterranea]
MGKPLIIAIDGPAASGKGTLSRRLANLYGLKHLDTGTLYRGVAWLMLRDDLDPRDAEAAAEVARAFDPEALGTADLRTPTVGRGASLVAVHEGVRKALFDFQRSFGLTPPGAVLDGRDIGTVIFPDATVKFFITASAEERAKRRYEELRVQDQSVTFENTLAELKRRDERDQNREEAPLKPAAEAEIIDTSKLTPDEVLGRASRIIDNIRKAMEA